MLQSGVILGWDAVWNETPKDLSSNATSQGAYAIDCSNTLLRSESPSQKIVGLNLEVLWRLPCQMLCSQCTK